MLSSRHGLVEQGAQAAIGQEHLQERTPLEVHAAAEQQWRNAGLRTEKRPNQSQTVCGEAGGSLSVGPGHDWTGDLPSGEMQAATQEAAEAAAKKTRLCR